MNPLTETDYKKLTKDQKETHELKVREELIEAGLIRPEVKEILTAEVEK